MVRVEIMRIWPIFLKRKMPSMVEGQGLALPLPQPRIELQNIVIGTTGFCNASCIHCPTNKPETRHIARGNMAMALFKRIVDQLAEPEVTITGPISLGLFGDSLMDTYIVERVAYLRKLLPNAFINVNTNGAAYSRDIHLKLRESVTSISLHIESLDPKTYNRLMAPLRLNRVLPKCLALVEDFAGKLFVSVPISRANYLEKDAIESFFLDRGAGHVQFAPLMNRSSNNPMFAELAFSPLAMTCRSSLLADVIVDWEGDVFACCQDFAKEMKVGDLSQQSLREMLASVERKKLGEMLDAGRWSELPTCSKCQYDCGSPESENKA